MCLCFDNYLLQELALYVQRHEETKSRKRGRSHQVHVNTKFKQLALDFHSLCGHHIVNALDHAIQYGLGSKTISNFGSTYVLT